MLYERQGMAGIQRTAYERIWKALTRKPDGISPRPLLQLDADGVNPHIADAGLIMRGDEPALDIVFNDSQLLEGFVEQLANSLRMDAIANLGIIDPHILQQFSSVESVGMLLLSEVCDENGRLHDSIVPHTSTVHHRCDRMKYMLERRHTEASRMRTGQAVA